MNARERFLAVMNFEPVDRTLKWEIGYWVRALRRWYAEGLPRGVGVREDLVDGDVILAEVFPAVNAERESDLHEFFDMDEPLLNVPLERWFVPPFEEEVLEDHGDWVLRRTKEGMVERNRKDRTGFPHWVQGAVANREDWERIKGERLRPTLEGRLPQEWPSLVKEFRGRSYPLYIGQHPAGLYGGTRLLLGQEQVLTAFYDHPTLVHDIMDYLTDFYISLYDQVLQQVEVDAAFIWEDLCYKNGPLISPEMFREFMLPNCKKLTGCLRDHGIEVIMVDTDGDARRLIPLLMEGGVNMLSPVEANAGMDVVELSESFPELRLLGGIDKLKIAAGREAIDEELQRKIPIMLDRGGYIPTVDHGVPPGISWEDFKYYREKLNTMIGGG